ncbi:MAG: helix-turn-helix domain-containing protein [Gaiellaceae bacterium]
MVGGRIHDNLPRLLGLQRLSGRMASDVLDVSQVALSAISTGRRKPSLDTLMTVSSFFEVPADRLMTAAFDDLLRNELSDAERYRRVEEKIRPGHEAALRDPVVQLVIDPDGEPRV